MVDDRRVVRLHPVPLFENPFPVSKYRCRGTHRPRTFHLSDTGNLALPVQGYTVYYEFSTSVCSRRDGTFHSPISPSVVASKERLLLRTAASGCGYMPQCVQLFLHIALLLGILENVAHIVGQHRCDRDLAFVILIRNAMDQAQAVQKEVWLYLFLRVFSSAFCSASSFS